MILYTIGYGKWPVKNRLRSMLDVLEFEKVNVVVDIRLSPCSSALSLESNYGPKPWNLQEENSGIAYFLENKDIKYIWLAELGNPQKNDPNQRILKQHIETKDDKWPVNRGLSILHKIVSGEMKCCILCACNDYNKCHRKTIAEALNNLFFKDCLTLRHL